MSETVEDFPIYPLNLVLAAWRVYREIGDIPPIELIPAVSEALKKTKD